MAISSSISVSVAVAHAVSFLTRPLMTSYPATTIIKLQLVLEANLTAHYAPSWVPFEPLSGSGRRCLTLSPDCLPPRVVYSACLATGIQWFDWSARLGGREFDFFVDPGCVYMRVGSSPETVTIWAAEGPSPMVPSVSVVVSSCLCLSRITHIYVSVILEHQDCRTAAPRRGLRY